MARTKTGLSIQMNIAGVRGTLRAFSKLPKDANEELRNGSLLIADKLAVSARVAGHFEGAQAALVASTVKPRRDRVPSVEAGGTKRLGRNRKPAWKLLFGAEFGSDRYQQFGKPHIGSGSYWFLDTVDREQEMIAREWLATADRIIDRFGGP